MKKLLATLALCAFSESAFATTISFELPGSEPAETIAAQYDCKGKKVSATYINAGSNSLAVLDLGGDIVVTVNVLSGSGARYAGQQYIWWTKGNEADLYDVTQGEEAPGVHCTPAG
jgi:membrane-bound inhibitor of C-type lysozyme